MSEKNNNQSKAKFSSDDITGPKPNPVWNILSTIGLLLIAAGTLMPILKGNDTIYRDMPSTFKYIFTAGSILLLTARILNTYKGKIIRLKRLYRIETWSSIFFCVAAFFLFYETDTTRNWLAFTLAGAAIQVYTSFMIPRTIRKAFKGEVQ